MCPVNTKMCVEQYRTVKHLPLYFYNIFWATYQKSKKGHILFNTAILLKHISCQVRDHTFLERDVKIYNNMISVKQQATTYDAHDY